MDHILSPGQVVLVGDGRVECRVEKFLGGGGQGEVYEAQLFGKPVALKWYYAPSATPEQYDILERLVKRDPPTDQFLWPTDLALSDDVRDFGYVMPLREPRFKGINDLMLGRAQMSFRSRVRVGYDLSYSLHRLHADGLCYRDISFGNVFFEPTTGEALICDNDNVTFNGVGAATISGTPRFMAPEIVRGEVSPSSETDLFSLAVLLFYIFHIGHPLEGKKEASIKCFDKPAMDKIYGSEPLFIYDPNDPSNRPEPGYNDNPDRYWKIYPKFLRDLFLQSFTVGLRDTRERVKDFQWQKAMRTLRNALFYCSNCTAENFYDHDFMRASAGARPACWNCAASMVLPYRIRAGREIIMLNADTELFASSLDPQQPWKDAAPIARIVRHPTTPGLWGLENLSSVRWAYTSPERKVVDVEPGKRAPVVAGGKINFGESYAEAEIGY